MDALIFVGPERRTRWLGLVVIATTVSLFEAAGAVLVFWLLGTVTGDGEPRVDIPPFSWIPGWSDGSGANLMWPAAMVGTFFLVRAALTLLQTYVQNRVAHQVGVEASTRLLRGYLSMPWTFHLGRNSAELIRNMYQSVHEVVVSVLAPAVDAVSETLLVAAILVILIISAPSITLGSIAIIGALLWVSLRWVQPRLVRLGAVNQREAQTSLVMLQQSLEGLREIRLSGTETYFVSRFATMRGRLARTRYLRATLSVVPRVTVETVLMLAIVGFLMVSVVQDGSGRDALAVLGLFAYGSLRVLPSLNRVVADVNSMRFGGVALSHVAADLELVERSGRGQGAQPASRLDFRESIRLESVSLTYPGTEQPALRDVNLEIRRGESIGIVGPTGGGKSTLLDVLIGILRPTGGRVTVDGQDLHGREPDWWASLGAVPQQVFLIDDTLRRNIALGIEDDAVDEVAVREAVTLAQLDTTVDELPDGLETVVGERGVRLSGGQRQRVAIARALYHRPDILIFDEGTSALDTNTERELIAAIDRLRGQLTLVIVAHRLATVRGCDRIVLVERGRVEGTGAYDDLFARSAGFRRLAE
jgi:ABC-type bacteriocin/lantibiotic exporter with double-glycine peptidase domain